MMTEKRQAAKEIYSLLVRAWRLARQHGLKITPDIEHAVDLFRVQMEFTAEFEEDNDDAAA